MRKSKDVGFQPASSSNEVMIDSMRLDVVIRPEMQRPSLALAIDVQTRSILCYRVTMGLHQQVPAK